MSIVCSPIDTAKRGSFMGVIEQDKFSGTFTTQALVDLPMSDRSLINLLTSGGK